MENKNNNFWKKLKEPRIRYGSLSAVITIIFIAFIVGINFGAKFLTEKFSLSFDLTANKVFSLTDESVNYIKNISKDVEITVLNDKDAFIQNGDYFKQADSVINEYAKHNEKVKVKYVNITNNPGFASNYPDEELDENSIIITSGSKHRAVSVYDIFNIQQTYTSAAVTSSKAEQIMTSAIMYVISDEQVKVTMLTGFDELPFDGFEKMLSDNNYNVVKKSMLTDSIDEDSSFAVIYAPKRDYDKESIQKIKDYLYNNGNYGKNLMCFLNPLQTNIPNLEGLIEEWGMKAADGIVWETDRSKLLYPANNYLNYICEYADETYSSNIKNTSIPVAMPMSKPIEILDSDKVSTLLEFSSSSVVAPSSIDENWEPEEAEVKGPIPAMAMSTMRNDENGLKSTVTIVGSATAVDESLLSRTSLNNSAYFLNLFNTVTERKDTINIESKTIGGQELSMNPMHAIIIGVCLAVVLPILVLVIGLAVWIIKKRK